MLHMCIIKIFNFKLMFWKHWTSFELQAKDGKICSFKFFKKLNSVYKNKVFTGMCLKGNTDAKILLYNFFFFWRLYIIFRQKTGIIIIIIIPGFQVRKPFMMIPCSAAPHQQGATHYDLLLKHETAFSRGAARATAWLRNHISTELATKRQWSGARKKKEL